LDQKLERQQEALEDDGNERFFDPLGAASLSIETSASSSFQVYQRFSFIFKRI